MSDDPVYWELSKEDYNLIEELPVCGCGSPNLAYDVYRRILAASAAFHDNPSQDAPGPYAATNGNEALFYVVAGVLDHIEATEHGGTIHYAWLTDKGRRLLALLVEWAESGYEATPFGSPEKKQ